VRKKSGIIIEYDGERVIFDPTSNNHDHPVFVTHAHSDHAAAFKHPDRPKYATRETAQLLRAMGWKKVDNLQEIQVGDKVQVGDLEIIARNAGHILGSVMYEVQTPEGSILYTGDICLEDTFTMDPAEVVDCDLLVIETTFGSPMFNFPKRKDVGLEMVRWALMDTIPQGKIPTFKTDSIGNAQEIISIFNSMTKLPVVTAKSATRVSNVYRENGYQLNYYDANSEDGKELLEMGRCALITPKGSKLKASNLDTALASGWAMLYRKRRMAFPLSDHADFKSLCRFIRGCKPRRVLAFHGGSMTRNFPEYVRKKMGIDAKQLTSRYETISGPVYEDASRVRFCSSHIVRMVKIPGFVYNQNWLVKELGRRGFSKKEVQNSLESLIHQDILKVSDDGFCIP
jgi:putative mRNA 3-end processing factor